MRTWLPLGSICLGTFLLLLDATIVTVALPAMHDYLGASFTQLQWVLDAYALALATLVLGAGALADRAGHKRVHIVGLVVFTVASAACALSPTSVALIAARVVQGVGGAAMLATTLALLSETYRGHRRGIAFGVWGAVSGATVAIGLLLGGVLTQTLGWRWIFAINIPAGLIAIWLSARCLANLTDVGRRRIDVPGVASFTVAAGALTFAIIRGYQDGWTSPEILGLCALSLVAVIAFIIIESRIREPMLDLGLFRRPSFVAVMMATLILQASAFAIMPTTSLWLQSVLGFSPIDTGLAFLPLAGAALVVAAASGRLLARVPHRVSIGVGLLAVSAGAALLSFIGADADSGFLTPGLLVIGVGAGLAISPVADAAMNSAPRERAGMASGTMNTFRQLGFALGIAVFGAVFQGRIGATMSGAGIPDADQVSSIIGAGGASAVIERAPAEAVVQISTVIHQAFVDGLGAVYLTASIIAACGGVLALALISPARTPVPSETSAPAEEDTMSDQGR